MITHHFPLDQINEAINTGLTAAETHKLMLAMPDILNGFIPEVSDRSRAAACGT